MQTTETDIPKLKLAGASLVSSGRLTEARNVFAQICAHDGTDLDAHMALGIVCGMLGNYSDAEKYLKKAIAINPDQTGPYYNLGIALKNTGDLDGAAKCYTKALHLDPNNAACHNNLGSIYLELRELDKAINCFNKAIELSPDSGDYHYNLGNALKTRGLRSDACNALEHSLHLKPDYIPALKDLGMVYISQGYPEKAEICYRQILNQNSGDEDAISGIANILARQRNFAEALAVLEPLLSKPPVSATIGLAFARICKHTDTGDDAIKLLEPMLENNSLSKDNQAQIHFMLGYFYDKNKRYRDAFKQYKNGNSLRRPSEEPRDYTEIVSRIISTFSTGFIKECGHSDTTSNLPVFIIGMPRSGTSLVEQILASHPNVYGGGELDTLPTLLKAMPLDTNSIPSYPINPATINKHTLNDISRKYIEDIKRLDPCAKRITDKMPGNFLNLGFIELLFPGTHIIHCKRDPLDTCLSCYFQDFDGHQYTTDLRTLARFYKQYDRLMKHWESTLTKKVHSVSYEDLVNNIEETSKKIIRYCGLEWDESCLDFYNNDRHVLTASMDQVNKPIYTKSVGRWNNYEEYIVELKSALSNQIAM